MTKVMIVTVAFLTVATAAAAPAHAELVFTNGRDFREMCANHSLALMYVTGVADGWAGRAATEGIAPVQTFCAPPHTTVTMGQATEVACKYAADHPEFLHYPAAAMVMVALQKAFPCSPQK